MAHSITLILLVGFDEKLEAKPPQSRGVKYSIATYSMSRPYSSFRVSGELRSVSSKAPKL